MSTKSSSKRETARKEVWVALDSLPNAVAICDVKSRVLFFNEAFSSLFQIGKTTPEKLLGSALFAEHDKRKRQDVSLIPGTSRIALLKKLDGTEFWGQISVSQPSVGQDQSTRILQIIDIDTLKRDHDTLKYRESTWRNAMANSEHGVWDYYSEVDEVYLSEGWKALRGIPNSATSTQCTADWAQNVHPDDYDRIMAINQQHNEGKLEKFAYEYREKRRDGEWIWIHSKGQAVERDAQNRPTRVVGIDMDVTKIKREEHLRLHEMEVTYQKHLTELEKANNEAERARKRAAIISNQDALTGLANRRAFSSQLAEFTGKNGQENRVDHFYLFLIDLDRFKPINDTYGHSTGDIVIQEVAKRIQTAICDRAVVARLGGDEFGIIVPCIDPDKGDKNAQRAAQKIIEAIHSPIFVDDIRLELGASIGISRYPECGRTESLLLRRADIAMYVAKKNKMTGIVLFEPHMEQKVISRAKLEADVRDAVMSQDFIPYFQPIIDLASGEVYGFEALARWNNPEHRNIGPGTFIPIIEHFGMMSKFGPPMLRKSLLSALEWGQNCKITFNVTANGVCDAQICTSILNCMREMNFPPDRFVIEVSEMALVSDIQNASRNMNRLRDEGITFALDDFGVGYSGLSYLRSLSFETLKLDRSFVSTMHECSESKKIVHAVLSLADQFGMKTVAEGIETDEMLQQVRDAGFTLGQGYLFEKAIPADEAQKFLNRPARTVKKAG